MAIVMTIDRLVEGVTLNSVVKERFLGITVLADFILNEGINGVLDNLTLRAGATAVAINPTVTVPSLEGVGSFQPPSDAGSSPGCSTGRCGASDRSG
jgi:hypothetical protein